MEKLDKHAGHALPRGRTEALRDAVLGLESLDDAGRLADLLVHQ